MKQKIKPIVNRAIEKIQNIDPKLIVVGIGGAVLFISSKRRQQLAIRSAYTKGYLEALLRIAR